MSKIKNEKRTVELMIHIYCRKKHESINELCEECEILKSYALDRLTKCPFGDKKSACKDCKVHCYNTIMRERIREIMRYSGPRMMLFYPCEFVKHLVKK